LNKIPKTVARRLSLYQRCLRNLISQGIKRVSSSELAKRLGIKSSQVRKDLSYFGAFGKRGVGYSTDYLLDMIERILGINKNWSVVLIGAGNLGHALINYDVLKKNGFYIVGIFDSDPRKIGQKIGKLTIKDITGFENFIKENKVEIGVIAVPPVSAQQVADIIVKSGIKGIINFSPTTIRVPKGVFVEEIDISIPFKNLTFKLTSSGFRKG